MRDGQAVEKERPSVGPSGWSRRPVGPSLDKTEPLGSELSKSATSKRHTRTRGQNGSRRHGACRGVRDTSVDTRVDTSVDTRLTWDGRWRVGSVFFVRRNQDVATWVRVAALEMERLVADHRILQLFLAMRRVWLLWYWCFGAVASCSSATRT